MVETYDPKAGPKLWDTAIERIKTMVLSGKALSAGASGGKDSTAVTILLLEALRQLVEEGHQNLPTCFVMNSNTRRENPMIAGYCEEYLTKVSIFARKNGLPLEVHQVEPPLTARFSWTCIARGKLPRFPGQSRDCAVSEKINPMKNLVKALEKEHGNEIIALVGSRVEESAARAQSMKKWSMDEVTIVEVDGNRTYAPIATWYLEDVWELISGCSGSKDQPPKLFKTFMENFDEITTLYRDANDGVCSVVVGNDGNRSACGSRFGCSYCTLSGKRDKSLESMVDESEEKYGFLRPFIAFRKFLLATRFDMDRRDFRGANVSKVNHFKVVPDYYSPEMKRDLLRFLITMDADEIDRAAKHEKLFYGGKIEDNEHNRLLCDPMFQNLTYDDVLAIDFYWSLERDFPEASPAARDFIEIHDMRRRYYPPAMEDSPRVTIPKARWFDISDALPFDEDVEGIQGLVPLTVQTSTLNISYGPELKVNLGAGYSYMDAVRRLYHELHLVDPSETCRAALDNGWLQISKGQLNRYERIATRNDYLRKLYFSTKPQYENERGDMALMSLNQFLISSSISDSEHTELLKEHEKELVKEQFETDLFGVESVFDVIDDIDFEKSPKPHAKEKKLTNIDDYKMAANQLSISI